MAVSIWQRVAADPNFAAKMLLLSAMDLAAVLLVNYAARGRRFRSAAQQIACQVPPRHLAPHLWLFR